MTACPAHLPHPDVAPGDGEVQRLYILRRHQGGGHGTTLLRTALEWLERDGPRTLWIGVWSENYGAQRFYARHGFEIVGEYSFMSATTPTASSSPAARRASHADRPASKGRQPADANAPREDWGGWPEERRCDDRSHHQHSDCPSSFYGSSM